MQWTLEWMEGTIPTAEMDLKQHTAFGRPQLPLADPSCICSPFLSPAAPCTCAPMWSGIYSAPGAQCKGSTLINLTGTGARASCLAHDCGDGLRIPGVFYCQCLEPFSGPSPVLVGPGHGVVEVGWGWEWG